MKIKKTSYYSTNRNLKNYGIKIFENNVSFKEALFLGISPDNGLFMPSKIPHFSIEEIISMKNLQYNEIAYRILNDFLDDDIESYVLKNILSQIYKFEIPIQQIDEFIYLMRLDQGPTCSFKDFGALFMAKIVELLNPYEELTVLVATSGDTGSAIGNAFKNKKNIMVYILYPDGKISYFQEKQLYSFGHNVIPIALKGSFDDCQRLVKLAFADSSLKELNLFSANSINIARLLPQIVYYFYGYLRIQKEAKPIIFSVPSGNLGNSLGCELARRMGLPVEKIIIATNENKVFTEFLNTGIYKKISPPIECSSNAMNVGNPSNIARFFDLYDGIIDKEGTVYKNPDLRKMKNYISSFSIDDKETIRTIKTLYKNTGIVLEPHGAVAIAAAKEYFKKNKKSEVICLATAHPIKFSELLLKELNAKVEMPHWIKLAEVDNEKDNKLENDYSEFRNFLLGRRGYK